MDYEYVELQRSEGVTRLVLNRPALNVLHIPMMRVDDFVGRLAALSAPVLRLTKRVIKEGLDTGFHAALQLAEDAYLNELMRLEDPHEGLAAFMEKRKPVWKDQ